MEARSRPGSGQPFWRSLAGCYPGLHAACALGGRRHHLVLVEASRGDDGGRNWLGVHDVAQGQRGAPGRPYVHTIRFGEPGRW